jgi:hypothetical protein
MTYKHNGSATSCLDVIAYVIEVTIYQTPKNEFFQSHMQ